MSRPQRYITRMVLFVAAVIAIVLLLFPALERSFMANPALNGLIIAVLLLGIGYIFRQVLMLKPEVAWLESYQTNRPASDNVPEPVLLAPMARMLGSAREG